ncbi:MAG TPA: hypothetical protein VGF99_14245 [Myxococcota bacterium]
MKAMSFAVVVALAAVAGCSDTATQLAGLGRQSQCEVDTDCCVAADACAATIYPVDRTQADAAVEILADDVGPCVDCISPRGIPRCVDGSCALERLGFDEDGPAMDDVGAGVSCLAVTGEDVPPAENAGSIRDAFSCSSVDDE